MRIQFSFRTGIATVLAVVMAAVPVSARTSCETIVELIAIEAQASVAIAGTDEAIERLIFAQMERMLMTHFADASSAAAESSLAAAYYSTRMMAVEIYHTQGRDNARLYMKSPSFKSLTEALHGLQKNRNCELTGGRTVIGGQGGTSPNHEISASGGQSEESTLSESTDPTRAEKVEVGNADPEALPILPLAIAVTVTALAAWILMRLRARRPEKRLSCNIVILVSNGAQIKESTLTDISRGGCKLIRNLNFAKGDPVKIMWAREWVTGHCMWADDDFCGVMFDTRLKKGQLEMLLSIDRYDEFLRASDLEALGLLEDEELEIGEAIAIDRELGTEMDVEWPHKSWTDASVETQNEEDETAEGAETVDGDDTGEDDAEVNAGKGPDTSANDGETSGDESGDDKGDNAGHAIEAEALDGDYEADESAETDNDAGATDEDADEPKATEDEVSESDDSDFHEEQLSFDALFGITEDDPVQQGDEPDAKTEDYDNVSDPEAAGAEDPEVQPAG